MKKGKLIPIVIASGLLINLVAFPIANASQAILNVSYDPTRELYREINPIFIDAWKKKDRGGN